jgi:predicted metal-dependent phosphotriesterase family hydrolase
LLARSLVKKVRRLDYCSFFREDPYACFDNANLSCEASAEEEIRAFKEAGGSLIVDTTPVGAGRNPRYKTHF